MLPEPAPKRQVVGGFAFGLDVAAAGLGRSGTSAIPSSASATIRPGGLFVLQAAILGIPDMLSGFFFDHDAVMLFCSELSEHVRERDCHPRH
jgi:hypothetical protein